VDYASHGPQMAPLCPRIEGALAGITPRPTELPMYSTLLDRPVEGTELDGRYWADNLREPVRFADAVRAVFAGRRPVLFVEISPHPVLASAIEDNVAEVDGAKAVVVGSLVRDEPGPGCLLAALATAYAFGCEPDWARLTEGGRYVPVPGHPLARTSFWIGGPAEPAATPVPATAMPRSADPAEQDQRPAVLLASPADCAREMLHRIAATLGIPAVTVDPDSSLTHLGVDSLFAGKIAYRLRAELSIPVSLRELLQGHSIRTLSETFHQRLAGKAECGRPLAS